MEKLKIRPDSASYSVDYAEENVYAKLDGGRSRVRKKVVNCSSVVNCQMTLSHKSYLYLMAFYRTATNSGSLPFKMDLIIDGELDERTCIFIPDSMKLTGQSGLSYMVSFRVEAEYKPHDTQADEDIIRNFQP